MLTEQQMHQRLKKALAHGHHFTDLPEIIEKVRAGQWQWHQNRDGVCITAIHENKRGERYLKGLFAFGDLNAVLELTDTVEEFARNENCVGIVFEARRGWEDFMKKLGWKTAGILMTKEI